MSDSESDGKEGSIMIGFYDVRRRLGCDMLEQFLIQCQHIFLLVLTPITAKQ
jgi:hypothetical protein